MEWVPAVWEMPRQRGEGREESESFASFLESEACAQAAGLNYLTDSGPGIRRKRSGRGFSYIAPSGKKIKDRQILERIRSLRIPPAWTDVWISPLPEGHLQATGRDARDRKQYLYHSAWRQVREQTKFHRMVPFGNALPRIRERVKRDLALPGLARNKVLATVVRLLEITLVRIGNKEYAKENHSFGLTTLRNRHLYVAGATLKFHFRGKSGKEHTVEVNDRHLARIVKRCRDIPGHELFQYLDDRGERRAIDSADVNAYLQDITGDRFTAKDFRTWGGTLRAAQVLMQIGPFSSESAARKNIVQAIKKVSEHLGNKPSVCRKYYVHPAILEAYRDCTLLPILQQTSERRRGAPWYKLQPLEEAVLSVMERIDRNDAVEEPEGPQRLCCRA